MVPEKKIYIFVIIFDHPYVICEIYLSKKKRKENSIISIDIQREEKKTLQVN